MMREPLARRVFPPPRWGQRSRGPHGPRGRSRAGNAGRGSCSAGQRAGGRIVSGREGAVLPGRGCVFTFTVPVLGQLFLTPKQRQQRVFLQGLCGSVRPCGMPHLRASLSCFGGCRRSSRCLGWRTNEGCPWSPLPVSCWVSLPGGFPQRPRHGQGHSGAGSCRRASAGNSSVSCTTNDFLRQTIGAAGSYRSPIPAGSALPGAQTQPQSHLSPNPGWEGRVPLISGASQMFLAALFRPGP